MTIAVAVRARHVVLCHDMRYTVCQDTIQQCRAPTTAIYCGDLSCNVFERCEKSGRVVNILAPRAVGARHCRALREGAPAIYYDHLPRNKWRCREEDDRIVYVFGTAGTVQRGAANEILGDFGSVSRK